MAHPQKRFICNCASFVILLTVVHMNGLSLVRDSKFLSKFRIEQSLEQRNDSGVFDDMDFQAFENNPLCGSAKCFFLSKSNNEFGYLVIHPSLFHNGKESYKFAKRLEDEYQLDLQLFPPELVPLSTSMAAKFSEYGQIETEHNRYENIREIVVQKMRTIENDAVLVGCNPTGGKTNQLLLAKLPDLIKESPGDSFYQNLKSSIEQTKKILVEHPLLFNDRQVLIDRFCNVHHMHFDRVFQHG